MQAALDAVCGATTAQELHARSQLIPVWQAVSATLQRCAKVHQIMRPEPELWGILLLNSLVPADQHSERDSKRDFMCVLLKQLLLTRACSRHSIGMQPCQDFSHALGDTRCIESLHACPSSEPCSGYALALAADIAG